MFQSSILNKLKVFFLLILLIPLNVGATVSPTKDFFVNDYANILSWEVKDYIQDKSIKLNNVDGTQIVVVTVPTLGGVSIEEYATRLFREFGIGDETENNGILILLAEEEREIRVEVGYGLEGIIPDGKAGRFIDQYMLPYLRNGNWDMGIKNGYDAFYKEIVELNNLNLDYASPRNVTKPMESSIPELLFWGFIGILIGYFCGLIVERKSSTLKGIIFAAVLGAMFILKPILSSVLYSSFLWFSIPFLIMYTIVILGVFNHVRYSDYRRRRPFSDDISSHTGFGGSVRGSSFRGGGGSSGGGGASRKF